MTFSVAWHPNPESMVNLEFPGDDWVAAMERIVKQLFPGQQYDNRRVEAILRARRMKKAA